MKEYRKLKIVMIGVGSCCFCPATLGDILLSDKLNALPLLKDNSTVGYKPANLTRWVELMERVIDEYY